MSMLKENNKLIAVKALMTGKWVKKGSCDNVNLMKLSSSSHSLDKDTLNGQWLPLQIWAKLLHNSILMKILLGKSKKLFQALKLVLQQNKIKH